MREFQPQPRLGIVYCGAGATSDSTKYAAGDFILVHHPKKLISKLIRFGQALRIHGDDKKFCYWNHAALIVSSNGDMVEALGHGVARTHITDYTENEYMIVRTGLYPADVKELLAFADYMVGEKYGFITITSIVLTILFGGNLVFAVQNQSICSGLVARAQERAGALFSRDPAHIMPSDLAKYYNVEQPNESR